MICTIELLGVARMLARTAEIPVALPAAATIEDAIAQLAAKVPALRNRVVTADGRSLAAGYACCVNGLDFVRTPAARVHDGDRLVILSADAGG
jgi:hypothetical protein